MWHTSLSTKILVAIFILTAGLKIYQFDKFPAGFHPDEQIYVAAAYAIRLTGSDLTGVWKPWSLAPFHKMYAELPALTYSLGYWLNSNPFFGGRLVPLFMGVTLPIFFFWVARHLFRDQKIAALVGIAAAFNPWIWQQSRQNFDPLPSIWFYFIGLVLLLSRRPRLQFLAILPFFLGFFQYQGLKIVFPFLIASTLLYLFWQQKTNWRHTARLAVIGAVLASVFVWYGLIRLPSQASSERVTGQTIFTQEFQARVAHNVDEERRVGLASPFAGVVANKATMLGTMMAQKFLAAFDLKRMFIANEPAISAFAVWSHGVFYLLDLFLIVLGMGYGLVHYRRATALLIFWVLAGTVPVLISETNDWFLFRMSWTYMSLIFFVGLGIYAALKSHKIFGWLIILAYLLSILTFSYHFYVRYPLYSGNGVRLHYRVVASYLKRASAKQPIYVGTNGVDGWVRYYMIYNRLPAEEVRRLVKPDFYSNGYAQINNIQFSRDCWTPEIFADPNRVVIQMLINQDDMDFCQNVDKKLIAASVPAHHLSVSSILDSGEQVRIYNDQLCQGFKLLPYHRITKISEFEMEKMSDQEFCQVWIKDMSKLENQTL